MTQSLSGVRPQPVIAICPGHPLLSVDETNRLLCQQGVALALAQGFLLDRVANTIRLKPSEEADLIGLYLQQEGVGSEAELQVWLKGKGWSPDDLRYFATKGERVRRYSLQRYGAEAEIRFLDRKLDLDQLTYSLLRVSDRDLADELYHQVLEGEQDFATLAETYSEGNETVTRGLIGPISATAGHPLLIEKLRVGSPGQIWAPFEIENVWVVVRLEQRFPAELDERMRQLMVDELFGIWFNEQVILLMAGEEPMAMPPASELSSTTP
ncbi:MULTISPECIES: peptidylprolyl isomerase [unclassified Synechococcus]|uniref:peptidylprolyl isomerase n=1 Tax=unclassified Synechococcus TaxID=2626047 RepID=UPI0000698F4D|nr:MULTISPECIES: peptidylprolyl isomerase [unclassified Synechococcus]EAQ74124.1 hypothetical protein WH5701_12458 [Synechococcus sp. WH 5701]WFN58389.1 peptidylprolyl isomerase [Synechococcus sp. CCFWC 502]